MLSFCKEHCTDPESRLATLNGFFFIILMAVAANSIAGIPMVSAAGLSPLLVGILGGMLYGNSIKGGLPKEWQPGIIFSTKHLLRFAIILYGFRLTIQEVQSVGMAGFGIDVFVIASTLAVGVFVGVKLLKMDVQQSLLCASGAAVCGAAAVLATESTLKAEPHKTAVAVSSVVIFGTVAMFIYPTLAEWLHLTPAQTGVYIGATVHEVAQVVGASGSFGSDVQDVAVISKMTRILLLAPMLILLGYVVNRWLPPAGADSADTGAAKQSGWAGFPIFTLWFVAAVVFNSFGILGKGTINAISQVDTFLLTMAMAALGVETTFDKFKKTGLRPFVLGFALLVWLATSGAVLVKLFM